MTPFLRIDLELPLDRFELHVEAELPRRAAILGPSGAGKSSLLEAVAGLRRGRGRVELEGRTLQDARRFEPPERRRLAWVPQEALLLPHLDVRANVLFGTGRDWRRRRLDDDPELRSLVELLELEPLLDRYPRFLSGGERRRVALARALAARPRLLLLDEPTQGLDALRARRVLGWLRRLEEERELPLLVVTHRREEALALAEEVVLLDRGRVVDRGPVRRMLLESLPPPREERRENLVEVRVLRHDPEAGGTRVELVDGSAELTLPPIPDVSPGRSIWAAIDAEEILVAVAPPHGLSARNVVAGTVEELIPGQDVWLRSAGWWAHLTPAASRELELAPGRRVWLVSKTQSWRVVAE